MGASVEGALNRHITKRLAIYQRKAKLKGTLKGEHALKD